MKFFGLFGQSQRLSVAFGVRHGEVGAEACELMKITAEDLLGFGVCDKIISEAAGSSMASSSHTARANAPPLPPSPSTTDTTGVRKVINSIRFLISKTDIDIMLENRYNKFRKIGMFEEQP